VHAIRVDGEEFLWTGRTWVAAATRTLVPTATAQQIHSLYVKTLPPPSEVAKELTSLLKNAPLDEKGVECLKSLLWEPRELTRSDLKLGYTMSPYWRSFRAELQRVLGKNCESCGSSGALDVHHFSYDRIGAETADDVGSLCPACHRYAHLGESTRVLRAVRESRVKKNLGNWNGPDAETVRRGAEELRRLYG
jgi:hypothetical protein